MDELTRYFIATSKSLKYLLHEEKDKQERQQQETESSISQSETATTEAPMNKNKAKSSTEKAHAEIENTLDKLKRRFKASFRQPKFIVEFAGFVILFFYAGYTVGMYYANRDSADAAKKSADTAKEAMISSHRAWIGLKDAPLISLSAERVDYSVVLKNFGPSPALRMNMVVLPMGIMDVTNNVFDKLCANASNIAELGPDSSLPNYGYSIFPEQPETINSYRPWVGTPPLDQPFAFVGCIAYVDEFHDGPTKTPIRHTRFCFATDAPIKTLLTAQNHVLAGSAYTKDCPLGHLAD